MSPALQLRDIHLPPAPSWWPPAPGWWLLALLILVAIALMARALLRRWRVRRRLAALQAEFDAAAALSEPSARVAAISQLLRRAARLRDPSAAALQGEAWLRFLDGVAGGAAPGAEQKSKPFSAGAGRVLLDGPFQVRADAHAADALVALARARFRTLVEAT